MFKVLFNKMFDFTMAEVHVDSFRKESIVNIYFSA